MARPWGGRVRPGAAWGEGCRDRARHAGQRGDVLGSRGDAVLGEGGTHPPPGTRRSMLVQGQLADAVVDGNAAPPGCQLLLAHLHPAQRAHREALWGTAQVGAVWLPPAPCTGGGPGAAPRPAEPPPTVATAQPPPHGPHIPATPGQEGPGELGRSPPPGRPHSAPAVPAYLGARLVLLSHGRTARAGLSLPAAGCHQLLPAHGEPCAQLGQRSPHQAPKPPPDARRGRVWCRCLRVLHSRLAISLLCRGVLGRREGGRAGRSRRCPWPRQPLTFQKSPSPKRSAGAKPVQASCGQSGGLRTNAVGQLHSPCSPTHQLLLAGGAALGAAGEPCRGLPLRGASGDVPVVGARGVLHPHPSRRQVRVRLEGVPGPEGVWGAGGAEAGTPAAPCSWAGTPGWSPCGGSCHTAGGHSQAGQRPRCHMESRWPPGRGPGQVGHPNTGPRGRGDVASRHRGPHQGDGHEALAVLGAPQHPQIPSRSPCHGVGLPSQPPPLGTPIPGTPRPPPAPRGSRPFPAAPPGGGSGQRSPGPCWSRRCPGNR